MLSKIDLKIQDQAALLDMARALSSPQRLDILRALNAQSMNVKELSETLGQPISSTAMHIGILEACDLIATEIQYSEKGKAKLCSRNCDAINIDLFEPVNTKTNQIVLSLPIGSYTDYDVKPTCGISTATYTLGQDNNEDTFFSPERFRAQLLWFSSGYVEYRISRKNLPNKLKALEFSFEACSEAPFYRNDWKSDITMWVNGVEIGTWTCPGDFGGRKGRLNPAWWSMSFTQYGMLTNWRLTDSGTYFGAERISGANLGSVHLDSCPYISFRIGVKADAYYRGGINLFGAAFGDYEQDILVSASW